MPTSTVFLAPFPNPSLTWGRWEFLPSLLSTNWTPPWICPRDSTGAMFIPGHQLFPRLWPFLLTLHLWMTPPSIWWLSLFHRILCPLSVFPASSLIQPSLTNELWNPLWAFLFSLPLLQFGNWFWSSCLVIRYVLCFSLILHSTASRMIFLKQRCAANFWSFSLFWVWGWNLLAWHLGAFEISIFVWLFSPPFLLLLNCLYSSNTRIYSYIYRYFSCTSEFPYCFLRRHSILCPV